MKKVCVVASVVLSTYACAVDWGIIGFPSYSVSAKEALSQFNVARNGDLDYVLEIQAVPSDQAKPSQFSESLSFWDAKGDWQTSRGTLQVLWHRAGANVPAAGWPVIQYKPTVEELLLMHPIMPD